MVESKLAPLCTKSVVLSSKNAATMPESKAFSTTQSVFDKAKPWRSEFGERNGEGGALIVKLRALSLSSPA